MAQWTLLPDAPAAPPAGPAFAPSVDVSGRPTPPPATVPAGQPGSELIPTAPSTKGEAGGQAGGTTTWKLLPPDVPAAAGPPPPAPPPAAPAPPPAATPAAVPAGQPMLPPGVGPAQMPMPMPMPMPMAPGAAAQAPQEASPPPPAPMPAGPPVPQGVAPAPQLPPGVAPAQMPPRPMVPMPTAPPTSGGFWGTLGHEGALGGEKFLEGMPLAVTGLADLANRGLGLAGLGIYPQGALSNLVERAYQGMGGLEPTTSGEQLWANIASAAGGVVPSLALGAGIPGMVGRALTAAPALQFAGAAGGGAAGTIAQRAGVGPGGQFAAALMGTLAGHSLGGMARGIPAMVRMGTTGGRQAAAGELLMRQAGMDPATFRARLQAVQPGGVPQTTGMATQAPGIMRLEKAVRGFTPKITDVEAQRAQATGQILQNLRRGTPMTTEERGQALRRVFSEQDDAMRTRADQLYERAKAVQGQFPTTKALQGVRDVGAKYYGPGSRAPGAFRSIAQQILERPRTASAEWLRNMEQQIGNEAGKAHAAGDRQLASALGELRDQVGDINPTPEHAAAKAFYRQYKSVTGRDPTGASATAQILRTDRFGNPMMQDAGVIGRAVKDPASVRQVLDMGDEAIRAAQASGASPAQVARLQAAKDTARELMREHFLDNAERTTRLTGDIIDSQGMAHPNYSPDKWRRYMGANQQVADQLFSRADQVRLGELTNILADNADAARTAKAPGSDTAQNLAMIAGKGSPATAHVLGAITGGSGQGGPLVDLVGRAITTAMGAHLFGAAGAWAAHGMGREIIEALRGHSDEMIRAMVHDAAADPEEAKLLVSKVSDATMARLMQRSQARGGALWRLLTLVGRKTAAGAAPAAAGTAVQYPRFVY